MTLAFSSTSARFALPLLYAAQAQKEVCVNEAFAIIDAVLQCAIEGIATVPPATPTEGTCWMVGTGGSGAWAGADGMIAAYQAGNWIMIAPRDGMVVLNLSNGQAMRHVALRSANWWRDCAQREFLQVRERARSTSSRSAHKTTETLHFCNK